MARRKHNYSPNFPCPNCIKTSPVEHLEATLKPHWVTYPRKTFALFDETDGQFLGGVRMHWCQKCGYVSLVLDVGELYQRELAKGEG